MNDGYISRSAYKLVQLSQKYHIFRPGRVVVDLGAAPGGWIQAALQECNLLRLYAVDLLPLEVTLPNVAFLQGDFTDVKTRHEFHAMMARDVPNVKADVVLSDMMTNTSGNKIRDAQASLDLCATAFVCYRRMRLTIGFLPRYSSRDSGSQ